MKLLAAIALTAASSWAIAQPPGPPGAPRQPPATIQVTGEAQVSEIPDRVYIDIGVSTQARRSEEAASQNAARLATVITAVKRAAGPTAQLTTTQYSVSPDYNYPRGGGTATVVGYTVGNVVQVRLDELRRIGGVIDAATQAGSNSVQNIRFALRDEQVARGQALRQAVLNASQDAGALADALGLKVVRVLAVDEGSPAVEPVYPRPRLFAQVRAAEAPTPVAAGTLDVSATVTLTVEVAPASR